MPAAVRAAGAVPRHRRIGKNRPFTPIPPPPPDPQPEQRVESSCCDDPKFEVIDGAKICVNCGTQISEQNIVAEVTFGETSTGAATVQGGFVGETARHAKTLGAAASRRIGGQYQSREETEQNGRSELRQLCPQLRIPQNIEDVAFNLWKLAASHNFIQGRRTNEVAGVCLYAACRRERHNTILLMDISEALSVNVFKLGDTYKELSKELYLEVHSHIQPVVEVEPLIMKYCSKLEFGEKTRQVAEDAARIIKRMKRDWMVTGRHPAGLCGACIILAARMNNFRRTVREIVFVVHVSDITVSMRLNEFKRTRSSTMSVQEFREKGLQLRVQHDPPSFGAAAERQRRLENQKKKRAARLEARTSVDPSVVSVSSRQSSEAPPEAAGDASQSDTANAANQNETQTPTPPTSQEASSQDPSAQSPPRRDAEGFAIPAIPNKPTGKRKRTADAATPDTSATIDADAASNGDTNEAHSAVPKKRGRPKAQDEPIYQFTEEDFLREGEIEEDIENLLQDPDCVSARIDTEREKLESRSAQLAAHEKTLSAAASAARLAALGRGPSAAVPDSEIIGEDEFADDPEVQNALLSEEAVRVKETIWLRDNEDWLRTQQQKMLKQKLDEAEGRGAETKKKRKRKRGRMGDGSVLTEKGTPVQSPADAAQRMLEKRAGKAFSRAVDYSALNRIFGGNVGPGEHEAKRLRRSRSSSVSSSVASSASAKTYTFVSENGELDEMHQAAKNMAEGAEQAKGEDGGVPVAKGRKGKGKGKDKGKGKERETEAEVEEEKDHGREKNREKEGEKGQEHDATAGADVVMTDVDDAQEEAARTRRGSQGEPITIPDQVSDDDDIDEEDEGSEYETVREAREESWAPSPPEDNFDDEERDFSRAKKDISGDFGAL